MFVIAGPWLRPSIASRGGCRKVPVSKVFSRLASATPRTTARSGGGYRYALDRNGNSDETTAMPAPLYWMAVLPMTLAVLGGLVDEWSHLGFSQWRSACRASGLTLEALAQFTLQLLPNAVLGALLGGVLVLGIGILRRDQACAADALGAHAGCVVGMAAGLLLCTLPLPVPVLLAGELALTVALAWFLRRFVPIRASVVTRTTGLTSA